MARQKLKFDEILSTPFESPTFYEAIQCKDGAHVSIQVGELLYCCPRNNDGDWSKVEAGFPSVQPPSSWTRYAEDSSKPLETIYPYIPVELVREFIEAHGGEA